MKVYMDVWVCVCVCVCLSSALNSPLILHMTETDPGKVLQHTGFPEAELVKFTPLTRCVQCPWSPCPLMTDPVVHSTMRTEHSLTNPHGFLSKALCAHNPESACGCMSPDLALSHCLSAQKLAPACVDPRVMIQGPCCHRMQQWLTVLPFPVGTKSSISPYPLLSPSPNAWISLCCKARGTTAVTWCHLKGSCGNACGGRGRSWPMD
jgi:hypothetical protein